eukprot:10767919-Alexandrium_andersonii.AAC.1
MAVVTVLIVAKAQCVAILLQSCIVSHSLSQLVLALTHEYDDTVHVARCDACVERAPLACHAVPRSLFSISFVWVRPVCRSSVAVKLHLSQVAFAT